MGVMATSSVAREPARAWFTFRGIAVTRTSLRGWDCRRAEDVDPTLDMMQDSAIVSKVC